MSTLFTFSFSQPNCYLGGLPTAKPQNHRNVVLNLIFFRLIRQAASERSPESGRLEIGGDELTLRGFTLRDDIVACSGPKLCIRRLIHPEPYVGFRTANCSASFSKCAMASFLESQQCSAYPHVHLHARTYHNPDMLTPSICSSQRPCSVLPSPAAC